jgi:quercetin dioxygenase-like cupin family protein
MRQKFMGLMAGAIMLCGSAAAGETPGAQTIFTPKDIKWTPAPAGLPAGAEIAALFGDPQKDGMFAMRIRAPRGFRVAPHTHPRQEFVTVISGRISIGIGGTVEPAETRSLPAGSFASIAPTAIHYLRADEDSVYQINALGPWRIDYVDPKDDPRLNGAPDPKLKFFTSRKQAPNPM